MKKSMIAVAMAILIVLLSTVTAFALETTLYVSSSFILVLPGEWTRIDAPTAVYYFKDSSFDVTKGGISIQETPMRGYDKSTMEAFNSLMFFSYKEGLTSDENKDTLETVSIPNGDSEIESIYFYVLLDSGEKLHYYNTLIYANNAFASVASISANPEEAQETLVDIINNYYSY